MVQAVPGSLPEGAVERSETEGVYFGERKSSKISEPTMAYGYPLARNNHRTTLPQSRPLGVPAPSEREPGRAVPLIVPPGNRNVARDFHRPYETQKSLRFTIHRTTLPQSWPQCSRASSFDFRAIPPAYPVRFPFAPMTRWHGMMMDMGL